MQVEPDDETFLVDNVFLGPEGVLLPWAARYSAYGIGAVLTIAFVIIENKLGIHKGLWYWVFPVVFATMITRWVGTHVTPDKPLRQILKVLWTETGDPRPLTKGESVTFNLAKIRNSWNGKVQMHG